MSHDVKVYSYDGSISVVHTCNLTLLPMFRVYCVCGKNGFDILIVIFRFKRRSVTINTW